MKQMAELSTAAAASGSTWRHNTIVQRDVPPLSSPPGRSSRASPPGAGVVWSNDKGETLAMPASGPSSTRDFRNSTEIVVGGYPLAPSCSTSPNPVPPRAALAVPPSRADSSSSPSSVSYPAASNIPVKQIITNYQRPFPGEPGRSRANSIVGQPPLNPPLSSLTSVLIASGGQGLTNSPIQQQEPGTRLTSCAGYPGIGTMSLVGRAPSPVHPTSAGTGVMQPYNRAGPVISAAAAAGNGGQQHSVTPSNPVGIALGPDGHVVHDQMAVQQRHPLHRPSSSAGQVQTQGYPPGPGPALTNHQWLLLLVLPTTVRTRTAPTHTRMACRRTIPAITTIRRGWWRCIVLRWMCVIVHGMPIGPVSLCREWNDGTIIIIARGWLQRWGGTCPMHPSP